MRLLLVFCAVFGVTFGTLAPLRQAAEKHERVPGRYIIKLKDGVTVDGFMNTAEFSTLNARVRHTYKKVINGLAVDLPEQYVDRLRALPGILDVHEGGIMKALQNVPSWGIDRVDQRGYPLDDKFDVRSTGAGVNIYVCDTGIRYTHNDFGGRARYYWDFEPNNAGNDCNGHGTHCTGTAGGATFGIARGATLYSGRVLNCFGSGIWDDLIQVLDMIAMETGKKRVVSLSLGGGKYDIVDEAVERCIASGAVIAIAAGNAYNDACWYTPARSPNGITVGATVYTWDSITGEKTGDARSDISNYGTCLDIFAPGQWIESTWHDADDATANLSGTSMATPHVAGAAALYLQEGVLPSNVVTRMTSDATANAIDDPGPESPNLILYVD